MVRVGSTSFGDAVATVGNGNDSAALPLTVTINSGRQTAVAFNSYTSDFITFINCVNTYQPWWSTVEC